MLIDLMTKINKDNTKLGKRERTYQKCKYKTYRHWLLWNWWNRHCLL